MIDIINISCHIFYQISSFVDSKNLDSTNVRAVNCKKMVYNTIWGMRDIYIYTCTYVLY